MVQVPPSALFPSLSIQIMKHLAIFSIFALAVFAAVPEVEELAAEDELPQVVPQHQAVGVQQPQEVEFQEPQVGGEAADEDELPGPLVFGGNVADLHAEDVPEGLPTFEDPAWRRTAYEEEDEEGSLAVTRTRI